MLTCTDTVFVVVVAVNSCGLFRYVISLELWDTYEIYITFILALESGHWLPNGNNPQRGQRKGWIQLWILCNLWGPSWSLCTEGATALLGRKGRGATASAIAAGLIGFCPAEAPTGWISSKVRLLGRYLDLVRE